jgi:opine dehydrogenase
MKVEMNRMKVGVVGAGGIGLAYAAWIGQRRHDVSVWSPHGSADVLSRESLSASGALEVTLRVACAASAQELAAFAEVILIAVPLNGHMTVMNALLPHLRSGQLVLVSSMASLSSLYLYEAALSHGANVRVASFGTTVLTARRRQPGRVDILTRRGSVPVSCVPRSGLENALEVCEVLFGEGGFTTEDNPLVSTLANTNAITHVPLALFNWTRIERGENWPQYHFMTPRVASVIEALDAERVAIANAFGMSVRSVNKHFSQSFNVDAERLEDIAVELHRRRGGPPGPTDMNTRFLSEDVPFGLVFLLALGQIAGIGTPITQTMVNMAGLIVGEDFAVGNDLLATLGLSSETVNGLLSRVNIADF